jgi:hypothetical protein
MSPEDTIRKIMLRVQYKTLSELSEKFPKKSIHPVMKHIDREMTIVLSEIENLNKKYEKRN